VGRAWKKKCIEVLDENWKEADHLEDLEIDGRLTHSLS